MAARWRERARDARADRGAPHPERNNSATAPRSPSNRGSPSTPERVAQVGAKPAVVPGRRVRAKTGSYLARARLSYVNAIAFHPTFVVSDNPMTIYRLYSLAPTRLGCTRRRENRDHGDMLAAHWAALDSHFQQHARMIDRFKDAGRDAVLSMWRTLTNEGGQRLSRFEREALIERRCELFGIWPCCPTRRLGDVKAHTQWLNLPNIGLPKAKQRIADQRRRVADQERLGAAKQVST